MYFGDCQPVLRYIGNLDCLKQPVIAVVGSRLCTQYGIEQAYSFAGEIAFSEITVISGGARGIDTAAHTSALKQNGSKVAVMDSGLCIVYPSEHASLFHRIVSGMSAVTLVIEPEKRNGALITA